MNPSSFPRLFAFGNRYAQSAGVNVTATASEAAIATMYERPSGASIRPSRPARKNNGRNTVMMIKVANTIDDRTSTDAR